MRLSIDRRAVGVMLTREHWCCQLGDLTLITVRAPNVSHALITGMYVVCAW
jgi:hypothetical protein